MYEINSDSFAMERAEAFAQGRAQEKANREKKKAELKKRITTGLLNYGFDLDAISDITGIDLSELERMTSKSC